MTFDVTTFLAQFIIIVILIAVYRYIPPFGTTCALNNAD